MALKFKKNSAGFAGDMVEKLKDPLALAFMGTVVGSGVKHGVIDPIREKSQIKKSKKDILKKYPNLAMADKEKVKDYFNVVKQYSPKAASNPLVAGAIVNRMNQYGGVDHKLVQDLVSIESGTKNPRSDVFHKTLDTGARLV